MVEVLKAGFYDSIQDLGRIGFQQYGVPVAGVMDTYAASLANSVLGNDVNNAVLEISMTGPTLKFHCDTAICVSGADLSPALNHIPINLNSSVQIKKDDILSFGKLKKGFRCYLAVLGGFKTELVLQSRSMFKGVTKQSKVLKNDILPIDEFTNGVNEKNASIKVNQNYIDSEWMSVFKGPEFDRLSQFQKEQLFSQEFKISKNNNRMAYQLEQALENNIQPIITSLVLPGTVQLTPSGSLIILMRDCQTTGGYPRVLQLGERSIQSLSQKFTGQVIQFKLIPMLSQPYL